MNNKEMTTIFVCGIGAIGSFLAEILIRSFDGVYVILVDGDRVETKNLLNQNYTYNDIGSTKVSALYKRIFSIASPNTTIFSGNVIVTAKNIHLVFRGHNASLVVDCFDNAHSRMLLNAYCLERSIPCLHVGMSNVHAGARWSSENYRVVDIDETPVCDRGAADVLTDIIRSAALGVDVIREYLRGGHRSDKMIFFGGDHEVS